MNNPQAFPHNEFRNTTEGLVAVGGSQGMTLLDYFAAKAMHHLYPNVGSHGYGVEACAKDAYDMAEAMLKEREKRMK